MRPGARYRYLGTTGQQYRKGLRLGSWCRAWEPERAEARRRDAAMAEGGASDCEHQQLGAPPRRCPFFGPAHLLDALQGPLA